MAVEEDKNRRLLTAFLGSLAMHVAFLATVSYGKIGPGSAGAPPPQPLARLEVSFSAAPADVPAAALELAPQACDHCTEPPPAAAPAVGDRDNGLPRYWPLALLDKPPRPLEEIDLNTPELDAFAVDGRVQLTALIGADGRVDDVQIVGSDTASDPSILNQLLAARFRNARFAPGMVAGKAVATALPITVVVEPR